jgi:putative ABC transport system ATP-binding protein
MRSATAGKADGGPVLELEGVSKVFQAEDVETHALEAVHLTVRPGEWLAIVGPSGSGKTTLLGILGLLELPTSGRYRLDGRPADGLGPRERARLRNERIGFVFQSFNLIGDLTVLANVELPLAYRGLGPAERRRRAEAALELVGMTHRSRHLPAQLSGGQQQRVAVARAIAGDPLIVLADEPTGNLDSVNGQMVMRLLQQLHLAGSTICMVTHDPAQARAATRIVRLFDGRVVEDAPVARTAP